VRVDAKAEGFERIAIPRGNVDIAEGALMVRDADGLAAPPSGESRQVYINNSNPKAPQTKDQAGINIGGVGRTFAVDVEGGGYSGINGTGLRMGLPFTDDFFVLGDMAAIEAAGPQTRLTLRREADPNAARTGEIKFGFPSDGAGELKATADPDESNLCFAIVERREAHLIWFTFSTTGFRN